jgi:hypothetical protein
MMEKPVVKNPMQVDLESFPRWLCKIVLMCKREDILTATERQLGLPGAIVKLSHLNPLIVSEHMGWVRNVVLMNVHFGSGTPQGVGISGRGGARWADGGNAGVSLRATQGRGGRILSQQGGFQVSGKGNKGNKGSKGIIVYITYLSYVYNGTNAVVNYTSCTLHNNNYRNECC